jgi:hypothetical protein
LGKSKEKFTQKRHKVTKEHRHKGKDVRCGAAGGRDGKKIKKQNVKIKNEETLRVDCFRGFDAGKK